MRRRAVEHLQKTINNSAENEPNAMRIGSAKDYLKRFTDEMDAIQKGDVLLPPPFDIRKVGSIGKFPRPFSNAFVIQKLSDSDAILEAPFDPNVPVEHDGPGKAIYATVYCKGFDFAHTKDNKQILLPVDRWFYVSGKQNKLPVVEPLTIPAKEADFFKKLERFKPKPEP